MARLSDGSSEGADLLVGADGIHSRVRSLAFGEEKRFVRQLGYHTAAFVFDDPDMQAESDDAIRDASAGAAAQEQISGESVIAPE